jgi:hypothetical protein
MNLLYVQCKLCTYLASRLALYPNGPNRAPPEPPHLGVPSGTSKAILWAYVWCKPSTYLATMLTLSQKTSERESTRPTSPKSSIRCLQYYYWAYGTFDTNHPPILHHGSTISKWTEPSFHLSLVTYESHRVRPKWFLCLWYVRRTPCTYLALTLTFSPNRLKWDFTWPTSVTSSTRCVQNYLWAYGTFSANRAPILRHE